jgi:hypothetical protein
MSKNVMTQPAQTKQHIVSNQLIEAFQSRGYSALAEQLRLCSACQLRCPGIQRCTVKQAKGREAGLVLPESSTHSRPSGLQLNRTCAANSQWVSVGNGGTREGSSMLF